MIYYDYTDRVEPFGLDESWIDVTGSLPLFGGDAMLVAMEISERVKSELGLTVSRRRLLEQGLCQAWQRQRSG